MPGGLRRWSRGSVPRAAASLLALGVLAGCSGGVEQAVETSASPTLAPTPTAPSSACPVGESTVPPELSDLTVNGAPLTPAPISLVVPYLGLQAGTPDRPSVIRIEATASASGSPVTFTAVGAQLLEVLDDSGWALAPDTLTVFSQPGAQRCTATAYLFSTKVGTAAVEIAGKTNVSASFNVVTTREAARNISLKVPVREVNAGDAVQAIADVTDAFGNPVENASVDFVVPPKGPGLFAAGTNSFTVLTDPKGRAAIAISTMRDKGSELLIRARGDLAACLPLENQYACKESEPVIGFTPASGSQKALVSVLAPTLSVSSPVPGTVLNAGETFDVVASTTGLPPGTPARVQAGGFPVGTGAVAADGSVLIERVPVQPGVSDYTLVVDGVEPVSLDVSVKRFGIVSYKVVPTGLKFRVTPGAFAAGTIIELTRDGVSVGRIEIVDQGADLYMFATDEPGVYQVQAEGAAGMVYGDAPATVL
ncbi:MAG: Ig-like domain-containing protein [bacterium]